MSGTLWQASPATIVFVFALAAFAISVGGFVVLKRRVIAAKIGERGQLVELPNRTVELIAAVGGGLFGAAGLALAGFAVVLITTSAAHQGA